MSHIAYVYFYEEASPVEFPLTTHSAGVAEMHLLDRKFDFVKFGKQLVAKRDIKTVKFTEVGK